MERTLYWIGIIFWYAGFALLFPGALYLVGPASIGDYTLVNAASGPGAMASLLFYVVLALFSLIIAAVLIGCSAIMRSNRRR